MRPRKNSNKVPPRPWTAPIDANIFKLFYYKFNGVHDKVYQLFEDRALLEEEIPDLTLKTLEGQEVSLRGFKGEKHLVLEFGALT